MIANKAQCSITAEYFAGHDVDGIGKILKFDHQFIQFYTFKKLMEANFFQKKVTKTCF